MKNKIIHLLLILCFSFAFVSCTNENNQEQSKTENTSETQTASENQETVNIKLGVVGTTSEEIWQPIKEKLQKEGINLEFVVFGSYPEPNNALDHGEIDLNSFQHYIYLKNEIDTHGYKIQSIANTVIVPLNLFSSKVKSIDEIKDGDSIAIPDDVTNGGRALKVLEATGFFTLKKDAGFNPTVEDIEKFNKKIEIKPLKASTIPSILPDVTAAIINAGIAQDAGLKASDAIYKDSRLDIEEYWNLIAARTEDLKDPKRVEIFRKIVEAYQSEDTKKVYKEKFDDSYIAVGWDQDLLSNLK